MRLASLLTFVVFACFAAPSLAQPTVDNAFPAHTVQAAQLAQATQLAQAAQQSDLSQMSRAGGWDAPGSFDASRFENSFRISRIGMIIGLVGTVATIFPVVDELNRNQDAIDAGTYDNVDLYTDLWSRGDYIALAIAARAGHLMWASGALIGANELRRGGVAAPRAGGIVAVVGAATGINLMTWIGAPIQTSVNRRYSAQLAGEPRRQMSWIAGPQRMGEGHGVGFQLTW